MLEPYLYDVPDDKPVLPHTPEKANFAKPGEFLTGLVKGVKARRDEELLARELDKSKAVLDYQFRIAVGAPRGMPGWKELDFLIQALFGYVAVEVDDMEFVHLGRGSEMTFEDAQRINGLADMGIGVHEIKHIDAAKLQDGAGARRVLRDLLLL